MLFHVGHAIVWTLQCRDQLDVVVSCEENFLCFERVTNRCLRAGKPKFSVNIHPKSSLFTYWKLVVLHSEAIKLLITEGKLPNGKQGSKESKGKPKFMPIFVDTCCLLVHLSYLCLLHKSTPFFHFHQFSTFQNWIISNSQFKLHIIVPTIGTNILRMHHDNHFHSTNVKNW
jgi:hypothetical protein